SSFTLQLTYNPESFTRDLAQRLLAHYVTLLAGIGRSQDRLLHEYSILDADENRGILVGYNVTGTDYPADACVHELFLEQAARHGEKTAVVCGDERLTYSELAERSALLASYLHSLGVAPDRL